MFTAFSLIKSYPVPQVDREALLWLLREYAKVPAGFWLMEVDFAEVEYKYCWGMGSSIMGAWMPLKKKTVYLRPEYEGDPMDFFGQPIYRSLTNKSSHAVAKSGWASIMSPTAVHELRHRWQRIKFGPALYTLLSLPLLREITLERDAHKLWRECEKFFEVLIAEIEGKEFQRRMKEKYK